MKKDAQTVSRRNFLAKSAGVAAATASILVIEAPAATNSGNAEKLVGSASPLTFDCNQAQTLTNKIIPSIDNILGTDYVNVKEFVIPCGSTDITDALNDAIDSLKNAGAGTSVPRGGLILIPRGRWTTRGGHNFYPSISIEGVGTQIDPNFYGVPWGTVLKLVANTNNQYSDYMFKIDSEQHNCSLKNLSIDLGSTTATGLLMTNDAVRATHIKFTTVENVTIAGGDYGIKVDSKLDGNGNNPNYESILHQFKRVCFLGCKTSFYSNTANSGFLIDTCYFLLPTNGIALHLVYLGSISIEHCLFVPSSGTQASNSTVLKTVGAFNSISFYDCQDEGIVYAYQNDVNPYDYISVVYRNCLIQSLFKFNAHGSVVLDSCRVYSSDTYGGAFIDSSTAAAKVYLKGQYNFFRWTPTIMYAGAPIASFNHAASRLVLESSEIGSPEIRPATETVPAYYVINKTRGLVNIDSGSSSVLIYNNLVSADSMIFTQLHTNDSGGVTIKNVTCFGEYFYINLTGNASNKLRVAFKVEV